jgi:hypothetical protein
MNLEIIEHHPQQVLEAFSRGKFDQVEIIGEADEKEFFELCFREKILVRIVGLPQSPLDWVKNMPDGLVCANRRDKASHCALPIAGSGMLPSVR